NHTQPNSDTTQQENPVDTEMTIPITELESIQTNTKMETDIASTISAHQDSSNTLTYSQVTRQNLISNTMQIDEDPTQKWLEHIHKELTREITQPFDSNTWHYDKLIISLQSSESLQDFIKYKIATKPTQKQIPPGISAKFKHLDWAFFLTFTRAKRFIPQHQTEYEEMFYSALQNYKKANQITITNKDIRDSIYQKLQQKLFLDFIMNTNFNTCPPRYITQLIKYYKGYIKDTTLNKYEEIQKAVQEAFSEKLQQLPSHPDDISENIQQILPFTLPIKNKAHTKAVVTALHRIYQFDQLPEEYFANLDPLLTNLANLHPAHQQQ
ncbi:2061_t:CDS:2, partial [Ambispora leptoticha]